MLLSKDDSWAAPDMWQTRSTEADGAVAVTGDAVARVLALAQQQKRFATAEATLLLSIRPEVEPDLYQMVLEASWELKTELFGGEVYPVVPVYVSSFCSENCLYCNYRAENTTAQIRRIRLTTEQLEQEVSFLIEHRGMRAIELVYPSDPALRPPQICAHAEAVVELVRQAGHGIVGLNAEPFDTAEYTDLRAAGVDFAVVWQETYDEPTYRRLHPGETKKSRFEYRLKAYEQMIQGGIKHIGLGVLLGLAPWREDFASLIAHEARLEEHYGITPSVLGIPRLKPAPGASLQETPFIPTDKEYLLAIAVHNLVYPTCLPFVNTREPWDLCVAAASGGGAMFTFDCSTIPGGYTMGVEGCQFPTFSFDANEHRGRLEAAGLSPVFDWDFERVAERAAASSG
jgi:2-iminoacetate synthase